LYSFSLFCCSLVMGLDELDVLIGSFCTA
jgi:hypothetical protein